jgi:hypothetical protein
MEVIVIQKEIIINDVTVRVIEDGKNTYYPIAFMGDKILLKDLSPSQLKNNGYDEYITQYEIDYGETTGGIQLTYCIEEKGLKEILKRSKIGRLSVEQKVAMNGLLKYLGMETIDTGERFIDRLSEDKIKEYSLFIQDCISEVLKEKPDVKWQKCSKCGNYYPYDECFFKENLNGSDKYPLNTNCRSCQAWDSNRSRISITHPDRELNVIYKKYGEDIFLMYKNHETLNIYKHILENKSIIYSKIKNKEDYLLILKYAYDNNWFDDVEDINNESIKKVCKIDTYTVGLSLKDIYMHLFNVDIDEDKINTLEKAKNIFYNYIKTNNINIDDVYKFNYSEIFKKASLRGFIKRKYDNDNLKFICALHDNKYAPYKFYGGYERYWKDKDNVNNALKYYIEQDQEIPIEKIPLYLTLNNLQKNARTLYTFIYKRRHHNTLFEWVNDVYPDMFEEMDFSIGSTRNYFDSKEEEIIYEYLKDAFKNVIYNKRNCDNTVEFRGMIPDYIVFTDNACYFVEYFGLYVPEKVGVSKRINDYVKKTDIKIEKYKTINHRVIHLFPKDLDDNMSGLKDKLKVII